MEKDELQTLASETNQLIEESNDVLHSTKLGETAKETSLKAYRGRLLRLKEKMNRIRRRRGEHQEFLASLSNDTKGNARGKM